MSTTSGPLLPILAVSPAGSATSRVICILVESSGRISSPAGGAAPGAWKHASLAQRLLVLTKDADEPDAPDEHPIELTLATNGDETTIVWEERAIPLDLLAAYGAGVQVHVEDLAAHLAKRDRCDAAVRFGELFPAYQELAANLSN